MSRIFVIGDLHLGHRNIIRYCGRPFASTEEMNSVIVDNWNDTIDECDSVYFLGDLALGDMCRWLPQLNGNITIIRGNHDRIIPPAVAYNTWAAFEYRRLPLLFIHNPAWAGSWRGWTIHGHTHNYTPFIDVGRRRVNVSCEVLDYYPMLLDNIVNIICLCDSRL